MIAQLVVRLGVGTVAFVSANIGRLAKSSVEAQPLRSDGSLRHGRRSGIVLSTEDREAVEFEALGPAWLFCPGDRPERFEKAARAADVVILDLEDSVSPHAKAEARRNVVAALRILDPVRTLVRINGLRTPWGETDLKELSTTTLQTTMLPKSEGPEDLQLLEAFNVVALVETAGGIMAAGDVAGSPNCIALCWGAEDLALDLGSTPRTSDSRLHPTAAFAQMIVRYEAAANGLPAIDSVWTDLANSEGLQAEAEEAASAGYFAKLAIHPSQVSVIRRAFQPDEAAMERARRLVAAVENSDEESGAVRIGDEMVDWPVIQRARRAIDRWGH